MASGSKNFLQIFILAGLLACGNKKFSESNINPICPTGYIPIPGDTRYFTDSFCVMKYEGKVSSGRIYSGEEGLPIKNITQSQAKLFCAFQGPKYRLINNQQWMTIAANISAQSSNWNSSQVGEGEVNRGHSDQTPFGPIAAGPDDDPCYLTENFDCTTSSFSQKRTHILSNGSVIWDFSGNVWEWVDFDSGGGKVTPSLDSWVDMSLETLQSGDGITVFDLLPNPIFHTFWQSNWGTPQGFGQYYGGQVGSGGAMARGGAWLATDISGIFATLLAIDNVTPLNIAGMRCTYRPT